MKKLQLLARHLMMLAFLIQFTSCNKLLDRLFPNHNHDNLCRITKFKQRLIDTEERTGTFYYNLYGDIDSLIFDIPAYGGNYFYYKYDQHHRLTDYEVYYHPGNYFHIHRYVYSSDGKIIIDTIRSHGSGSGTDVNYLEYDALGRVIKESQKTIEAEGDSTVQERGSWTYQYDDRGNLRYPSAEDSYDDKISFLSTRWVLMFTERNFSKNNPREAIGYTSHLLPTGFEPGLESGLGPFLWGYPSEISYECW